MRDSKTVTRPDANGVLQTTTTKHIWDGAHIVADIIFDPNNPTDPSRNFTATFYRGLGGQLISTTQQGQTFNYLHNGLGDVIGLLDSLGNMVADYRFDAFGNQLNADGTWLSSEENRRVNTIHNPFRYRGHGYFDSHTGFIYQRHRFLDTTLGRFINEDPIRWGYNWYCYAMQNPIMFIDPWGLSPTSEEAALMAQLMYTFNSSTDLSDIDRAQRMISVSDGREWVINDLWVEGSVIMGDFALVDYAGADPRELAVVFQGTTDSLLDGWWLSADWHANIAAGANTNAVNLVTARNFGQAIVDLAPDDMTITFVGHSKGGGEAIAAALATGRNAITFNAANFNFGRATMQQGQSIRNYYVRGEELQHRLGVASIGTTVWLDTVYFTTNWRRQQVPDRRANHGIAAVITALGNK